MILKIQKAYVLKTDTVGKIYTTNIPYLENSK